ncbi:TPA: TIGR03503 family protein [Photobacterium damselae]
MSVLKRLLLLLIWISPFSWAQDSTSMSLLDNRFRIDQDVQSVSFIIHRQKSSEAAILVRPDGQKYYAWRHPNNVTWYQQPDLDIVSIEKPMAGPWQALGKISPHNSITVLSDVHLNAQQLPERLYQGETLKFSAQLWQGNEPLQLAAYLSHVKLKISFTDLTSKPKDGQILPSIVLAEFFDDGQKRDERAGDGIFTANLKVDIPPGRYQATIATENGVFLRQLEQTVLVYPTPLTYSFMAGETVKDNSEFVAKVTDDQLQAGSLAGHIAIKSPSGKEYIVQGATQGQEKQLNLTFPTMDKVGRYRWYGWLYATDNFNQRELIFSLPKRSFALAAQMQLTKDLQQLKQEELVKQQQEKIKQQQLAEAKQRDDALLWLIVGNSVMVLVILIGWYGLRWWKKKRQHKSDDLMLP